MVTGRVINFSFLDNNDIRLFAEGKHRTLYNKLGSHSITVDGSEGTYFGVWAPQAIEISVVGDFNLWNNKSHLLKRRTDSSGIWEGFVPDVKNGALYKYHIRGPRSYEANKGDPFAFYWEHIQGSSPSGPASIVWDLTFGWNDGKWIDSGHANNNLNAPLSIYEVHLGSWRRYYSDDGKNSFLTYKELAEQLSEYLVDMKFTHVELLPVMEHPFYGSWGYQTLGYFAPTSRYGNPQDFMFLVNTLHKKGIGVILDWVPSHFPTDEYGLVYFDGTNLFEYEDYRKRFQPDWNSYIFDYNKPQVRSFLTSSAIFWLDKYHADGLRVDGVASMLYLDYSRKENEWTPNQFGGRENLEAVSFLKMLNEAVYSSYSEVQTYAEESTAWPQVSRPTYMGGLGFGLKWNMGWTHDTLDYFSKDPINRKYEQNKITFSIWYAFYENFILPLSHDEIVYGKRSIMNKMPGDVWQKFANLRLLLGYMFAHPGKKLLFMGAEFAQFNEWYHEKSLDWQLLEYGPHKGISNFVRDLNRTYREEEALHGLDFDSRGFEWVDFTDWQNSVISFLRKSKNNDGDVVLAAFNFTPVPRINYRLGVPRGGTWYEILNSDAKDYSGSGLGNLGKVEAKPESSHGRHYCLDLLLPPLGAIYLKNPKLKSKSKLKQK